MHWQNPRHCHLWLRAFQEAEAASDWVEVEVVECVWGLLQRDPRHRERGNKIQSTRRSPIYCLNRLLVARVGVGVNAGAVLGAARSRRGRPSWALGAGVPAVNPGAWGRILAAWGWHWQALA
jgi:hypothetical protein